MLQYHPVEPINLFRPQSLPFQYLLIGIWSNLPRATD
jgi:hypothetical protein